MISINEYKIGLNNALEEVFYEVSYLEEQGCSNYSVSKPVSVHKPEFGSITLTSKEEDTFLQQADCFTQALQRKNWEKTIEYNWPFYVIPSFWKLINRGTFMYGQERPNSRAVVGRVNATIDCESMAPFNCVTNKTVSRIDPSVVRILGKTDYIHFLGRFTGNVEHGYLDVEVNGTGNVRVTRATFSNWNA